MSFEESALARHRRYRGEADRSLGLVREAERVARRFSGRILGFSEQVGESPCQIFAVYRDGVWKTRGVFVEKARGKVDDPDEVLHGFCLRVLGRLVDLAAPTGGSGRRWGEGPYTPADLRDGKMFPTQTRWFK